MQPKGIDHFAWLSLAFTCFPLPIFLFSLPFPSLLFSSPSHHFSSLEILTQMNHFHHFYYPSNYLILQCQPSGNAFKRK
jgi:hypothetical protein